MKRASPESLHKLLLLAVPTLKVEDVQHERVRLHAMKELMLRIHPRNFPGNEDAANIYEDVQHFYEQCCKIISKESSYDDEGGDKENEITLNTKKHGPKTNKIDDSLNLVCKVIQFNVRQKWLFLDGYCRPLPPEGETVTSGKVLAPLLAYQCINARGAIVHGSKPSLIYSWQNSNACIGQSVTDVFAKHGGHRSIKTIDEIKLEIIHNGPVVSLTFIPSEQFALRYKRSIVDSRINKRHYVIVLGWKLTEHGEVWLAQDYVGNTMEVPVGQYHLEDLVAVPKDNLESTTWQKGPYFDRDMSKSQGWMNWKSIEFLIRTNELEALAEVFEGVGFHEAMAKKRRFVIRDKNKAANSRSCRLFEVTWDTTENLWKVKCIFTDAGGLPDTD